MIYNVVTSWYIDAVKNTITDACQWSIQSILSILFIH